MVFSFILMSLGFSTLTVYVLFLNSWSRSILMSSTLQKLTTAVGIINDFVKQHLKLSWIEFEYLPK